jgi:hypothetical protein
MRSLAEGEQPDALPAVDLQGIYGTRRCRAGIGGGNGGVVETRQQLPARASRRGGVQTNATNPVS